MSAISFPVPIKARFIPTENVFLAPFNTITPGKYDFGAVSGGLSAAQVVIPLQGNSLYLIDRYSVGGDIASEVFLASQGATPPLLSLQYSITGENVYSRPIPVVSFVNDRESVVWAWSHKGDDNLSLRVSGVLNQVAETVGKDPIRMHVSLAIYAIEDRDYIAKFHDRLSGSFSDAVR